MKVCSIFSQVLKLFSRGEFEKAVKEHKAERHARGFTSWGQFMAMLFGSSPKSVMALEALWMLELPSQRGFRDRARRCVSAPAKPANVDGAVFFDSLGRNARLSERSEPAPRAESIPGCSDPREAGRAKGGCSRTGASPSSQQTICTAANPQFIDGKALIANYTFRIGTQMRCVRNPRFPL